MSFTPKKMGFSIIVQQYIKGECSKEELDAALSIFEDPYHNLELRQILFEIWNSEETEVNSFSENEHLIGLLSEIHHRINLDESKQRKRNLRKSAIVLSKIAAILILGVFLGMVVNKFKSTEPVYYTSLAPNGSVSQLILPDNTMVYLNSGSEIKYSMDGFKGQREVFLKGEGWFKVAKNKKKPFVVHTSFYDVNVLGTEFNVNAYPSDDRISTTLEKGSIIISSTKELKLHSARVLKPGEQLVFNKIDNSLSLKKVNTRQFTSWKENKLIFIDMRLKELVILLERKYGVEIEVSDSSILNYHYDGTIRNETIFEVLNILKESLPIHYKIIGQKIYILKNN